MRAITIHSHFQTRPREAQWLAQGHTGLPASFFVVSQGTKRCYTEVKPWGLEPGFSERNSGSFHFPFASCANLMQSTQKRAWPIVGGG